MQQCDVTEEAMVREPVTAIYIHIPFCQQKCHYCDFLSLPRPGEMPRYVTALVAELELAVQQVPLAVRSIFIGGGTPSCLPEPLLEQVLAAVQRLLVGPDLIEYTLEANPGTLSAEKLALCRCYGVNRLSMGVQSDDAQLLRQLGRIHSYAQVEETMAMARAAGFTNINVDLMYGLPGQTADQWATTLAHVLQLEPEHISLYQLKIEAGTVLGDQLEQGRLCEFDDEGALAMYRLAQEITAAHGYAQYEISNYARPGYASVHNQVYWRTEAYLGLGLGACTFLPPHRWNNVIDFADYYAAIALGLLPRQAPELLTVREQQEETVFMALRMNQGLEETRFVQRYGQTLLQAFPKAIACCQDRGWLEQADGFWRLTEAGRVLGNLVFLEFMD